MSAFVVCVLGSVVISTMRKRNCPIGEPVLFVTVRRMDIVPNCALVGLHSGAFAHLRAQAVGLHGRADVRASSVVGMSAERSMGLVEFSGPGAPSLRPAEARRGGGVRAGEVRDVVARIPREARGPVIAEEGVLKVLRRLGPSGGEARALAVEFGDARVAHGVEPRGHDEVRRVGRAEERDARVVRDVYRVTARAAPAGVENRVADGSRRAE